MKTIYRLFFLCLLLFQFHKSDATTCIAIANGNWSSSATWSCGSVPNNNDTLLIPAGITVNMDVNTSAYTSMLLIVNGTLNFASGKVLNMACSSSVYVRSTGSVKGGSSSSMINVCGINKWTGPGAANGVLKYGTVPNDMLISRTITNLTCFNNSTGKVDLTITDGIPPFSYAWSNTTFTKNLKNVAAGTYTVTVTDFATATITTTATITEPGLLVANLSKTNVVCKNACNGTATAAPTGGTTPFTYVWNPGSKITAAISGLCPNTYSCSVTDNNGCTSTGSVTITEPTALVTVTSVADTVCQNVCTGTSSVSASGAISPYTYSWSSNTATGPTATGYCAGTYTVVVQDANGCSVSNTIAVIQRPTIFYTLSVLQNVSCTGNTNGKLKFSVTGGKKPYVFNWNPAVGIDSTANNLAEGTYSVSVTDNYNCVVTSSIGLVALTQTPVAPNVSRCDTGLVTMNASGPDSIFWFHQLSGGVALDTAKFYSVHLTKSDTFYIERHNGCITPRSRVIATYKALPNVIASTSNDTICKGASAILSAVNAATYLWMPGSLSGDSVSVSPTTFTTYTVTAAGLNGCIKTDTVQVAVIASPDINSTPSTDETCFGDASGTASVSASGGTGLLSYTWNTVPISHTSSVNNLVHRTYNVTVTDSKGCKATSSVIILPGDKPVITFSGTDSICKGNSTAITAGGGLTYTWLPTDSLSCASCASIVADPIVSTTYTLTISDAIGCTASDTVRVRVDTLTPATFVLPGSIDSLCLFSTPVVLSGGGPAGGIYSGTNVSGGSYDPQTTGVHTITYTYSNGNCASSATQDIFVDICTGIKSLQSKEEGLKIYPNPNNGQFVIQSDRATIISVVDETGRVVFNTQLNSANNYFVQPEKFDAGIYFIRSTSLTGEVVSFKKIVIE